MTQPWPMKTRRTDVPNYGVLVADDNAELRDLLDVALRRRGFSVWSAADGREALALFAAHCASIDVILLDICMPNLDGLETLAALKTMKPRRPCCLMSGDIGENTDEEVRAAGAERFFAKPFRIDELGDALLELAVGLSRAAGSVIRA